MSGGPDYTARHRISDLEIKVQRLVQRIESLEYEAQKSTAKKIEVKGGDPVPGDDNYQPWAKAST